MNTAAGVPPAKKLLVIIAMPLRHFAGMEDLPRVVGAALRELATRGTGKMTMGPGSEGQVDRAFRLEANKYEFEFMAVVGGLCRARNEAVKEFLLAKGEFLLWWDDDLQPVGMTPGEAVLRILSHRQPVVGGLYCKRAKKPAWVCSWLTTAELKFDRKKDGLLQVLELGTGFKCYHRKVFTEIGRIYGTDVEADKGNRGNSILYRDRDSGEKVFGFFQNLVLHGELLSEDYFLDFLSANVRVPVCCDVKLKLRHRDADGSSYPPNDAFPPIPAVDQEEAEKESAP